MPSEHFDLQATVDAVYQAIIGLICHIGFDAGVHGLILALIIGLTGLILTQKKTRFGKPLIAVFRKLALFCAIMMLPGIVALAVEHQLPSTGVLHVSSLGFIAFWSLITLHLSAEEMNYQWF